MKRKIFITGIAVSTVLLSSNLFANSGAQNPANPGYSYQPIMQQQMPMQGNYNNAQDPNYIGIPQFADPSMNYNNQLNNQPIMGQNPGFGFDPQLGLNDPYMNQPQMNMPMQEMDAPGVTNPLSIRALVETANAQISPAQLDGLNRGVQAYVDGNLSDARQYFTEVTQMFGEGVASDRAYLGLAKIERAYGAYDVSRRILEAVVRKNRDYESIMLARRSYEDLLEEVNRATQAAQLESEMSYARYQQVGWLNIFEKIKTYNQYKEAKANYEALLISSQQFDPIFAQQNISTPISQANIPEGAQIGPNGMTVAPTVSESVPADIEDKINSTLTMEELRAAFSSTILDEKQGSGVTAGDMYAPIGYQPSSGSINQEPQLLISPAPTQTVEPTATEPQPVETPAVAKPLPASLDEARQAYLDAYEELKGALRNDDAKARQEAQAKYQEALKIYNSMKQ
jgi:hypothetical protein